MLPRYLGWFSATFSGTIFFLADPQVVRNGDLVVCGPVLSRGHLEKFRDWAKNKKTPFPGAGGPEIEGGNFFTMLSGMVVRNFLHFTFCLTGPPGAGNREKRGF